MRTTKAFSDWSVNRGYGQGEDVSKDFAVRIELVRLLYRQARQALISSVTVALIVGIVLWEAADHYWLKSWFTSLKI